MLCPCCRIEVAENQKKGDVGTEERVMEAKTRIAAIEAENLKQQNERAQDVQRSNNELIQMRADIEANNLKQQNERAQAVEQSNNKLKLVRLCLGHYSQGTGDYALALMGGMAPNFAISPQPRCSHGDLVQAAA